jgi:membrane protein implicated in regulation of membrane protease activity
MFEWWNSLELATQIFYCIAIPSTLILLVQTVLTFIGIGDGADADVDADVEIDADGPDGVFGEDASAETGDIEGMEGLRLFTFRGIIAFLVVLGWVGVAMTASNVSLYITIPVALVCGFAMMFSLALIFRAVMKLRSDGNADNRNAIGTAGKVQLTIPPARTGEGKVHVMLQGSYVERSAVTDDGEAIPTGCEIIVVGVSGQTDLVVKRK